MATISLNFQDFNTWQGDSQRFLRMLNTTRRNFVEYAVAQNIGKVSPLAKYLLRGAGERPYQPAWLIQPVIPDAEYRDSSGTPIGVQYLTNSDTFTINQGVPNVVNAQYEASVLLQTCRLSYKDIVTMKSPYVIVDLVEIVVNSAMLSVLKELATRLATHDGSATVNEKIQGIQDIIDNGTRCVNLGGIDRTTETWWNSYIYNAQTSAFGWNGATWTIPYYQVIQRIIAKWIEDTGGQYDIPPVAFTSFGTFQAIAESFTSLERYVVGDAGGITDMRAYDVRGLMIGPVAIFPDPYITDPVMYFINPEHVKFDYASPFAFYMDEWRPEFINGRLSFMSLMITGGNLWTDKPRAHFAAINLPTI